MGALGALWILREEGGEGEREREREREREISIFWELSMSETESKRKMLQNGVVESPNGVLRTPFVSTSI